MDIPNTGAIFTLGKSHLAENTQSYFYIKNDPIRSLVAGPYQSAVICESGRLFVWGENHHGQLGIGGHHSPNADNAINNNVDITIKPTCVKSLKTLGLKIADVSFGNGWSIVLTYSNELFFSGRNIFSRDASVSTNFTEAKVNGELCEIIRKPFRLEEFDDCLSNNEEAENFSKVLAGNDHFLVLTTFGRLIGWGSNNFHQLGRSTEDAILRPHEIVLDSPILQYTCGPESTLVLTQNGKLYLTGRLNEFVFPSFTELQKNLSSNEQIIFMNISKASEIFIVTNTGSIYRSYESVRNKSLIFQRFYDYDSEENGPIWKLLKGTSFYAVLTKAHKFYTTFSESGHHLKTFREISKFKNLRILDMGLGDKHVLVHGIPRSSTLAASTGPGGENRFLAQSVGMMSNTVGGGAVSKITNDKSTVFDGPQTTRSSKYSNLEENDEKPLQTSASAQMEDTVALNNNELPAHDGIERGILDLANAAGMKESQESIESFDTGNTVLNKKSPTESLRSHAGSTSSLKTETENATKSVKSLRPRTPFPESSPFGSPKSTMKKTPKRNLSYETAINNDVMKHNYSSVVGSLEHISEHMEKKPANLPDLSVSTPTPPTDEDEELRLEISEVTDPLNRTVTVNEIRFINNGIDVTANVKKAKSEVSTDSLDDTDDEEADCHDVNKTLEVRKEAENLIEELEEQIAKKVAVDKLDNQSDGAVKSKCGESTLSEAKDYIEHAVKEAGESVDSKLTEAKEALGNAANRAAKSARGTAENLSDNTKKAAQSAKQTIENVGSSIVGASDEARHAINQMGNNVVKATGDTKESVNSAIRKIACDTRQAVGTVTTRISTEVHDAKNTLSSMLQVKKNKVDVQKPTEPITPDDNLLTEATSKASDGNNSNTTTQSNNTTTGQHEDDERTTASANSCHIVSSSNPFESAESFDPELDAMIQRGKQALREELQAASVAAENKTMRKVDNIAEEKTKFSKFLEEMKEKTKGLSCRNEKTIQIAEDQPPRYSVDDELAIQPVNGHASGSKVCTIL